MSILKALWAMIVYGVLAMVLAYLLGRLRGLSGFTDTGHRRLIIDIILIAFIFRLLNSFSFFQSVTNLF